jgi:hypothetical protein
MPAWDRRNRLQATAEEKLAAANRELAETKRKLAKASGKGGGKDVNGAGKDTYNGKATGKGKGSAKGKGDGGSKAKGKGKQTSDWWQCKSNLCKTHQGGAFEWNHGGRDVCHVCLTPKPAAEVNRTDDLAKLREKAAAEQKKSAAAEEGLKAEENKRRKAAEEEKKQAAEKKKAEEAKKQAASPQVKPPDVDMGADEEPDPAAGLDLPQEFRDLQKAMFVPKPMSEEWDAEATLLTLLPDSSGRTKDTIQKEIDAATTMLSIEGSGIVVDFEACRKQKAALEKELAKVEKGTPTGRVGLAALRLAKEKYLETEKEKADRAVKGTEKEAERVRRLKEICSEKVQAWQAVMNQVGEKTAERQQIWDSRRLKESQRQTEILELFDARVRAAEAKETPDVGAGQQVPPPLQLASPAPQKSQEQIDAESFQKSMTQLMWFSSYQQSDVVDVATLGTPTAEALPTFTTMYAWMTESVKGDQMMPFTFEQMGCGSIEVAKGLVGEAVWSKTFQVDAVLVKDVCPYQLRMTIFAQLKLFSTHLKTAAKEQAGAAKESLAAASAGWATRKIRASPYGA